VKAPIGEGKDPMGVYRAGNQRWETTFPNEKAGGGKGSEKRLASFGGKRAKEIRQEHIREIQKMEVDEGKKVWRVT